MTSRRTHALVAVSLGTFMTYLDNNIVNVALPTIQRQLHLFQAGIEWVVSAYVVCLAGLLLAGGRLADVLDRRRLFGAGLALFTVASLVAGLAGGAGLLIGARAAQGIGAALLTPTTLAIITDLYPEPGEQARAIGIWGAVGALGLAAGPLLGGLLAQHASWHWIFTINVPIGVATLALGRWAVPADADRSARALDLPGITTSAVSLLALTYGLIEGPQTSWLAGPVLGAFALSIAAAAAFVVAERRSADPMLDLSLFADRVLAGGIGAQALWAFGLFGIYFFTSLYLQDVLRFGPTEAGLAFVPMALCMAAGATASDRLAPRVGVHRLVGGAMVLMGAGMASVALLGAHAGWLELMPGFVTIGVGGGLTIPLTGAVVAGMPAERAGVASAVFNASREVAGLLGITVIGVVLSARRTASLHAGHTPLAAFLSGYRLGLVVAAALVAAGGALAWATLRARRPVVAPLLVVGA